MTESLVASLLHFAESKARKKNQCELFGADTQGAGFSQSARGDLQGAGTLKHVFAGDAVRYADNSSPSLTLNQMRGTHLFDGGNLDLSNLNAAQQIELVTRRFVAILQQEMHPICLGGDHLIKYAALSALEQTQTQCGILYVDAHPDCLATPEVNYASILHHAVHKLGFKPDSICILGLRQMTLQESLDLNSLGVPFISSHDFQHLGPQVTAETLFKKFAHFDKIYVSLDLDAFHCSEAPAVEAAFPGGIFFSPFVELLRLLANKFSFVGMDLSEYLPQFDVNQVTGLHAAALVKEFYALASKNLQT